MARPGDGEPVAGPRRFGNLIRPGADVVLASRSPDIILVPAQGTACPPEADRAAAVEAVLIEA